MPLTETQANPDVHSVLIKSRDITRPGTANVTFAGRLDRSSTDAQKTKFVGCLPSCSDSVSAMMFQRLVTSLQIIERAQREATIAHFQAAKSAALARALDDLVENIAPNVSNTSLEGDQRGTDHGKTQDKIGRNSMLRSRGQLNVRLPMFAKDSMEVRRLGQDSGLEIPRNMSMKEREALKQLPLAHSTTCRVRAKLARAVAARSVHAPAETRKVLASLMDEGELRKNAVPGARFDLGLPNTKSYIRRNSCRQSGVVLDEPDHISAQNQDARGPSQSSSQIGGMPREVQSGLSQQETIQRILLRRDLIEELTAIRPPPVPIKSEQSLVLSVSESMQAKQCGDTLYSLYCRFHLESVVRLAKDLSKHAESVRSVKETQENMKRARDIHTRESLNLVADSAVHAIDGTITASSVVEDCIRRSCASFGLATAKASLSNSDRRERHAMARHDPSLAACVRDFVREEILDVALSQIPLTRNSEVRSSAALRAVEMCWQD